MARFDLGKREAIAPNPRNRRTKPSKLWVFGGVALLALTGYLVIKRDEGEADEAYKETFDEAA